MSKRGFPIASGGPGGGNGSPGGPGGNIGDAKRMRADGGPGGPAGGGGGATIPGPSLDPEELSDALRSAGVDLREEENLLSSTLTGGGVHAHAPRETDDMFLDYGQLKAVVGRLTSEQGLHFQPPESNGDTANGLTDPLALVSASCQEWLAELLTDAAMYSRHRRLSRNPTQPTEASQTSKILKAIVQQDKDAEQRRQTMKMSLGIGESGDEGAEGSNGGGSGKNKKKVQESEEAQQRAANDTARMMTAGKKRFAWLAGGSAGSSRSLGGTRRQAADPARFREVKEEPGIVLRDLLCALEEKHMGVKRSLIKGYGRVRD